jgi:hypothetical protein
MANVLPHPWWFFTGPWRGLTLSHLFFGGLMLFGLLIVTRRKPAFQAARQDRH